jgi:dihydroxyacid dehydratase/phosphogluconate dehydratase
MFPAGNIAPDGSVIKSTAIDPSLINENGIYLHKGPAKVFTSEKAAIAAIKQKEIEAGDVMVVTGCGPVGTGMEETYQLTSALKFLPFGKNVALVTDARFSGVSTGACIGHVGPEGLAGGPIGKLKNGDIISIEINIKQLEGLVNFVGEGKDRFDVEEGAKRLAKREIREDISAHPELPDDTKLWAALQGVGGGTWGGCVFNVEEIVERLRSS